MNTQVIETYYYADFPNGKVNAVILEREINEASGVTNKPVTVVDRGAQVDITFTVLLSSSEETALNAVVAAHQGEDFQTAEQSTHAYDDIHGEDPLEVLDSTWVDVFDFDSGALRIGDYQLLYSAEHKVDQEIDGDDSELRMMLWVDAFQTFVECNFDTVQSSKYQSFSNGLVHKIDKEGLHVRIKMQFRKTGGGPAKGLLRRGRLVQSLRHTQGN